MFIWFRPLGLSEGTKPLLILVKPPLLTVIIPLLSFCTLVNLSPHPVLLKVKYLWSGAVAAAHPVAVALVVI
jgi:hypothetical protein